MFIEELQRSIERTPREGLPALSAALWKAFGAGAVTEAEAETLSQLIEARRATGRTLAAPAPRRLVGSQPRSTASLERRRRWCASGYLPPALAARFTPAETAALSVIAVEAGHQGKCSLPIGRIAALAGISESSVRNALRAARALGLIRVEVRRVSAFRNDTNLVSVVSPEWQAWLRHRAKRGGCKSLKGTNKDSKNQASSSATEVQKGAAGRGHAGSATRFRASSRFAERSATKVSQHASDAWSCSE